MDTMNVIKQHIGRVTLLIAVAYLGGCAVYQPGPQRAGDAYPSARVSQAEFGVISSIDVLHSSQQVSGSGAAAGGVTGAAIGRQFGGSGEGRAMGTFVGALIGVLIGNQIEVQQRGIRDGVRVTVQLESGATRSFDYANAGDLRVGERVQVNGQQMLRM